MSKLIDDLQWEDSRKDDDLYTKATIRLCPSGGFWRSYNHSAWLLLSLARKMKVHVDMHDGRKVAQVGFPVQNVQNWLPAGYVFEMADNGYALMKPSDSSHLPDLDIISPIYGEWFASLEVSARQDKRKPPKSAHPGSLMSEMNVDQDKLLLQILAFPIEQKTPLECVSFLSGLKVKLADILFRDTMNPDTVNGENDGMLNTSDHTE